MRHDELLPEQKVEVRTCRDSQQMRERADQKLSRSRRRLLDGIKQGAARIGEWDPAERTPYASCFPCSDIERRLNG